MKKLFKKINKEKLFNFIILLIVIAMYIFVFLGIYSNFRERKRKETKENIIEKIDEVIENIKEEQINNTDSNIDITPTETETKYNGINYTVLGKITIRKINIYEPILKENTKEAYDTALVKVTGVDLNKNGNLVIGGHNFMKGNYFIKINKLVKDDVITITDLSGNNVNYYVYDYKTTTIDDPSYLTQPENKDEKIITLVTCTKGGKERYYVKAKAK